MDLCWVIGRKSLHCSASAKIGTVSAVNTACISERCTKTGYSAHAWDRSSCRLSGRSPKQFQLASGKDSQDIFSVSKNEKKKERKKGAESWCSMPKLWLSPTAIGHNENCSAECAQWRWDRSTRCTAAQWGCYTHDKHLSLPRRTA